MINSKYRCANDEGIFVLSVEASVLYPLSASIVRCLVNQRDNPNVLINGVGGKP